MKRFLLSSAVSALAIGCLWATGASATTLYIGVSVGGGPIGAVVSTSSPGTLSEATGNYSGGGSVITINSLTATSSIPLPTLTSSTMDVTAASSSGSALLYISEIGETNLSFAQFVSTFNVTGYNTTAGGTVTGVTESTYASSCAAAVCTAADAFASAAANQLASHSFTGDASPAATDTNVPGTLDSQYVVTLVYSITWATHTGPESHGNVTAAINLTNQGVAAPPPPVPLPAAFPLFASGLGALGLLGWRKKRKAA
jgi:hypothetical protein